jgi:hypothetical protein
LDVVITSNEDVVLLVAVTVQNVEAVTVLMWFWCNYVHVLEPPHPKACHNRNWELNLLATQAHLLWLWSNTIMICEWERFWDSNHYLEDINSQTKCCNYAVNSHIVICHMCFVFKIHVSL